MRLVALVLVVVVVSGFVAFKTDDAPAEVSCGQVTSGGYTVTGKGISLARKVGSAMHDLATGPAPTVGETQRVVEGVMFDVLWFWARTLVQTARGEKLDPKIIEVERKAAKAAEDANTSCTPCPTVQAPDEEGGGTDPGEVSPASLRAGDGFSAENRSIAKTADRVRRQHRLPFRASVVIVAAGMQESGPNGPRNLRYGHSSSVGVWQLIDTHGTVAQRMDVAWAADWFFDQLEKVPNWEEMPVGQAAQEVERSAFPDRYARWEDDARRLLASVSAAPDTDDDSNDVRAPDSPDTDPAPELQCVGPEGSPDNPDGDVEVAVVAGTKKVRDPSSGVTYSVPIPAGPRGKAIQFALDQLGEPYRFGSPGPDSWDCSSVTAAAWRHAGVQVTPYTEAMIRELPRTSSPKPGDLVYKPGHVQMWLGKINGAPTILEAPRTGLKVRIVRQWMNPTAYLDPTKKGQPT